MKTNYKFTLPMLALAATSALVSCSDKEEGWYEKGLPDPSKDVIAFTSNGSGVVTRATTAPAHKAFTADTKIVMRMKSEDQLTTGNRGVRYTRTVAVAKAHNDNNHKEISTIVPGESHSDVEFTSDKYRYWDDAFGRDAKLSIYAIAVPNKNADGVLSTDKLTDGTTFVNGTTWFTEATENETFTWSLNADQSSNDYVDNNDICYSNNIRKETTEYPIKDNGRYNPAYSDGSDTWSWSLIKGQLQWNAKTTGSTTGKFDYGNLVFYHSLCQLTINLIEDDGFNHSANDFKFKDGTNVQLTGFPTSGTFNIASGSWSSPTSSTITKVYESSTLAANMTHVLHAITLPGRNLLTETGNVMSFTIDDNAYYVTGEQIAKAIQNYYKTGGPGAGDYNASVYAEFSTMTQGHHYVINVKVGKSKINNITAQIVDWEQVNTEDIDPIHTYFNCDLEINNYSTTQYYQSGKESNFDIYRTANTTDDIVTDNNTNKFDWKTGYNGTGNKADKVWDTTREQNRWKATNWYWPDNKTFYHFRIVGDHATTSPVPPAIVTATEDYFVIKGGALSGTTNYKDYTWGAPFKDKTTDTKFFYSLFKGFDAISKDDASTSETDQTKHQIYRAIGATNDMVNMIMFHMTSQIEVTVQTSVENDSVALYIPDATTEHTKIEILNFYEEGHVNVGNGLVTQSGSLTEKQPISFLKFVANNHTESTAATVPSKSIFDYGIVPQPLKVTGDGAHTVGLRITTPDGNQYVVKDISTISATVTDNNLHIPYSASSTSGEYIIDRWYPGYKYHYTVTLLKTGIINITAQLVDWETVTGNIGNITLED